MSNHDNETPRFRIFAATLDRIEAVDPTPYIKSVLVDAVCEANEGAPADLIEARTRALSYQRIYTRERNKAISDLIDSIDLNAIRDEAARVIAEENEQDAIRSAWARLDELGIDTALIDIELKGCTFAEHLEWINTAPADELRAYRAEMSGGDA
jgi:hypothetical protein